MLKIDIIHGSRDAWAAGVSLGWKGKTNCISNLQQHAERAKSVDAPLPRGRCLGAGGTGESLASVPLPACAHLPRLQGTRVGFGVSPPHSRGGSQMF